MKKLRQKIVNVRDNVRLITDKKKTGGGGSWSFISLTALYTALNPLLNEYNLDIEIEDISADNGEFVKVSVIDLESGIEKSSIMKLKESDKQGIQHVQNREAQKSFFVRTAIISLFRLNIETYNDKGANDIAGAKQDMEQINLLVRKLKVKAGVEYVKKIEIENGKKIADLPLATLQAYMAKVEEIIKRKREVAKGSKNESK